jgi:hypothetical protein
MNPKLHLQLLMQELHLSKLLAHSVSNEPSRCYTLAWHIFCMQVPVLVLVDIAQLQWGQTLLESSTAAALQLSSLRQLHGVQVNVTHYDSRTLDQICTGADWMDLAMHAASDAASF